MNKDLTTGKPASVLLRFTLPMLLSVAFQQLYNIADSVIAGKFAGEDALAAVGASYPVTMIFMAVAFGMNIGISVVISQLFGAKDFKEMKTAAYTGFISVAVLGVVLTVVGTVLCEPILRMLGTPENIMEDTALYLAIYIWGLLFLFIYNISSGVFTSLGDSKTPLYAMVIASILNIGLDLLFVMVFHWGIAGAVIATVIAQLFAALYCLRAVLHVKVIHLKKEYFRLNPEIAKRLLGLGTPVAAQNVIIAVGGMVVQSVVNRYGTLFVAGFTATNKLYGILEIAAVSFSYAVTTYVGQNLGAGLLDRVKKGMHSATWIALLTSVVITVFVLIFGKYGIALFISGTAEEVSISSQVAIHYLNIMSICLSILYMLHIYRSALMGLGDTIMPMASGIMEFLMRIGVALFLPLIIGQEGIFYAEVTAWAGAAVLLVTTYFLRMHKLTRGLDTSQSKAGE